MTHTLKTIQPYYDDVLKGAKNFELRKMDRPFNDGDIVILQEFVDGKLTGREQTFRIDYILADCPQYGLMEGYCILGLKEDSIRY
jgi:hypothetical protein